MIGFAGPGLIRTTILRARFSADRESQARDGATRRSSPGSTSPIRINSEGSVQSVPGITPRLESSPAQPDDTRPRRLARVPNMRRPRHLLQLALTLASLFGFVHGGRALHADDNPATSSPPKGEVTKYTFDRSKIFPGTVRDYWVYVPKQYDPAKPACLYVSQDGIQYNAPEVFDELIDKKEMPVVIGVFVTPGRVKAPSDQAIDRFNRSFEYDGLGDDYVRFLLEELLPEVETRNDRRRPADPAVEGRQRPLHRRRQQRRDLPRSRRPGSGPMPSAASSARSAPMSACAAATCIRRSIRKYEPKPIRIFLQDGSSDLNIYGGDWWMANQEMERALIFAGYEVNHDWGTGGHNGQHATRDLPRRHALALERLAGARQGRGRLAASSGRSSSRARAGRSSPTATGSPRDRPSTRRARCSSTTSPTARPTRSASTARSASWLAETKHANGQAFGPDGRLYAVAAKTRSSPTTPTGSPPSSPRGSAATTSSSATTAGST